MPRTLRSFVPALAALILVALAAGALQAAQAPQAPPPVTSAELAAKLPVDPDVTLGTLPNGLKYYIRRNALPEKRAELRLVVNAGSLLEDDDQQGLAHFVEHMAFNGTKNFPKSEMVAFLESIGMRFGPSVNAFTSFDETVYKLQIPTDKADVVDRSFQILEDWARHVTFDPVEIDKERGVIMEEWRLRRGAQARMQDQQLPVLLKGSRYADRLPIGTPEILQNFKHERLRAYYADWYRPDLMAVIAVGDFDVAAIAAQIKSRFGGMTAPAKSRPRPTFDVPKQPGTLYTIATDPEAPMTMVSVYSKMPFRDPSTLGAYRQQITERLFGSMLSARLAEIAQKPDAPFMGAGSSRGLFVKSAEASTLSAAAKDGQVTGALEVLFTETERVTRHGFTGTELDREKTAFLRALEQALAEMDKRPSAQLADEYVRNFTQAEPFPGLANEVAIVRRLLPGITLGEVNGLAREWMPEGNRVVMVSAPQKAGVIVPDEAALAAALKSAAGRPIEAYADRTTEKPFFSATPRPGAVTRTNVRADVGITEWTLSNGVTVVLKPTTFKEDEIAFRAFSPGGTSLVADADLIWAEPAATLIAQSGLGEFSRLELRKMLTGKLANVSPGIGDLEEIVVGSASVKDIETMFQMIYLTFTAPRADPDIFQLMKSQTQMLLGNMRTQPAFAFQEALNDALTQGHPRNRTPTAEMLEQMNLEKAFAFYKDRFSDAGDFTFVFVGTIDPATLKPLVERYLGSLPATGRKETWKDHGVTSPSTVVRRRVEKGLEPQSRASLVFTGPFTYNQEQRIAIRALASILQTRLRETLREELGGTYSVSAGASYTKIPKAEYSLAVDFGSNPARTDELIARVLAEIEALKTTGPTAAQVADAREGFIRDHETNIKNNGYLLSQIVGKYQLGEEDEVGVLFELPAWYQKLTAAAVQEAAKRYLNTDRYVQVTLFPEKK
jgi:zinc protease